jgi:glycosyltransferase involved in cell wall biosynthesis
MSKSIKKILFINDTTKQIGGAENYLYALKKMLEDKGYQVKIIGGSGGVSLSQSFFSRWFSIKYYRETNKIIKAFNPNIVHVHSIARVVSPSVFLAVKQSNLPLIQTTHDYNNICSKLWMINDEEEILNAHTSFFECLIHHKPKKFIIYSFFKLIKTSFHDFFIRRYVDVFLCGSSDIRSRIESKYDNKIVVQFPYFVDEESFKPAKIQNYSTIFFSGRLSKEKGVDVLLHAVKILSKNHPKLNVNIIGEGPEKNKLIWLANDLKLDNVNFLGKIPYSEIPKYYINATVVVIPSVWLETGPLVAIEAAFTGRPVIASDCGGMKDIVINGVTGFLFRRNSPEDLAEKLRIIMSDKKLINKMSKNQIKITEKYSAEKHLKIIENLYNSL